MQIRTAFPCREWLLYKQKNISMSMKVKILPDSLAEHAKFRSEI